MQNELARYMGASMKTWPIYIEPNINQCYRKRRNGTWTTTRLPQMRLSCMALSCGRKVEDDVLHYGMHGHAPKQSC